MLTPRENVLEVINWGKPEYIPMLLEAFYLCGLGTVPFFEQPWASGKDPFGTNWIVTKEGAMPDVSTVLFDDIADWKKYVKFPDVEAVDISTIAEEELSKIDRNQAMMLFIHPCGIFERLAAFMGFENALIALITDPDSCKDFFDAMTDYRIKVAGKIIDAYHPDGYCNADDVASAKSTFMSPEVYRELIKPYHKKFGDYITSRGLVYMQHTCGRCEAILEDFIDEGVKVWMSAQVMNDLPAIQKRFKGRMAIEGGWDSQGKPGYMNATDEEVRSEIRRVVADYGKGGGFIVSPEFNE